MGFSLVEKDIDLHISSYGILTMRAKGPLLKYRL